MKVKQAKQVCELLQGIDIDVLPEDIKDIEDFEELREWAEDHQCFDVEIIYYAKAMDYLQEHDNSLSESMEIASGMGYEVSSLNSELLASLLASQNVREEFSELESEIDEILA